MRPSTKNPYPAMLIAFVLLVCLGCVSGKECPENQFMSAFLAKCVNCSECQHPETMVRPCERSRDTLCGQSLKSPPLKLDWSWIKHESDKTEAVKEMTETFQENKQRIKQHEMHVQQMHQLLQQVKNGNKLDDLGEESQELWNHLKALGRVEEKKPEIAKDLVHKLQKPNALSEDPKIFEIPFEVPMHFNSEEASDLLKSAANGDNDENDWPSPYEPLKFQDDHLVKKFGFFPLDDDVNEAEDDMDDADEKDKPFSFSEKVVLDYQTAVAVFSVTTVVVFFLALLCYCFKTSKGSFAYPDNLTDLQFWSKYQTKPDKLVPSTIYKTTTEVIGKESSGNYKYLERIINKAVNKSRVPSKIYRAAKPSMETRPLTADWRAAVHSPKSKFQDSLQTV